MARRNVPAMSAHPFRLALAASLAVAAVAACEPQTRMGLPLVPAPAELLVNALDTFTVSHETPVVVDAGDAEAVRTGIPHHEAGRAETGPRGRGWNTRPARAGGPIA